MPRPNRLTRAERKRAADALEGVLAQVDDADQHTAAAAYVAGAIDGLRGVVPPEQPSRDDSASQETGSP